MLRRRGSSFVGLVVTAVIAVPSMAFVMNRTLSNTPDRKLELTAASGAVSISNSQDGQAVLEAHPMIPGQQTTGTVQLANTGDGAESMVLDAGAPVDQPGAGGGHLSERLRLRVDDITSGTATTVYSGALAGLHLTDLGTWAKGESRTYRFVVTFPDGGANGADNAFQGSAASIGFTWTAGAAGPAEPPADAPYEQQVAGDAPLAYWPLDGSQADMSDIVGNHAGQFSNSVTTADVAAPGGGKASSFDGSTSYGYVADLAAPTDAYTIEAWVRPADTNDTLVADHGSGPALGIRDGHFAFRQTDTILLSSASVEAGRWWHLVGTWDASSGSARLYVDGHLSAQTAAPTAPSGSSTLYIGRGSWTHAAGQSAASTSEFFRGELAQVSYYPSALDAGRVAAHWHAGEIKTTTVPATPATAPAQANPSAAPPATGGQPSTSPPASGGGTTVQPGGDTASHPAGSGCPRVSATGGKKKPAKKPAKKPHKKPHKKPAKKKPAKKANAQRGCTAPTARANKTASKRASN